MTMCQSGSKLPYLTGKGKKGLSLWHFYLNRNHCDPRFCPVIYMLMWIRVGSIFPHIRSEEALKAARLQSFSYDQNTMDQWASDNNGLVHLFHDDFSSVISHLFGIVVTVYIS